MAREAVERIHQTVLKYVDSGAAGRVTLSPRAHSRAERLLIAHETGPLRARDALHLALAIDADVEALVTFDGHLARAARGVGVHALP